MAFAKRTCMLVAALAAIAVTTPNGAAGKQKPYVPIPGYVCSVGQAFEDEVWITRRIDEHGVQHDAHMDWKPKSEIWQPRVLGLWGSYNAKALDMADGSIFLEWGVKEEVFPRRSRPPLLSIELSTRLRPGPWPASPFFAKASRDTGTRSILTNWSDLRAYVRGADQLYVVLRDRKGAIYRQQPLPREIFEKGETAIRAAMAKMDALSTDYRNQCQHVGDISDGDIIVT